VPLSIEWPHELVSTLSESREVTHAGQTFTLLDTELQLLGHTPTGDIDFEVVSPSWRLPYRFVFNEDKAPTFAALGDDARIRTAKSDARLADYLSAHGLLVTFEDEIVMTPDGYLLKPKRDRHLFPKDSIEVFDWSGVNIRKESQGVERDSTTVQFRTIEKLMAETDWEVVIDDDGSGELADIVLMRRAEKDLEVLFVHCKYSKKATPGARIDDLYDVCGQAMKMNRAKSLPELIARRLLRRETARQKEGRTGIVHGSSESLALLVREARFRKLRATIAIVQPGMSKAGVSEDMRALLGGTDRFLADTHGVKFRVVGSA
jgi:hypothetical protein